MATYEIDRERWTPFFDKFTQNHEHWLVTIEVLSRSFGDQIQVQDLPLRGISAGGGEAQSIEIQVMDEADRHLSHTISGPQRVWLKQADENGADEVLEVETSDGATLVHLRSTVVVSAMDAG